MIKTKNKIVGTIKTKNILQGVISPAELKIYPELENIEITPRAFEQKFNHPNSYGYDEITVKAMAINLQDKEITDDGVYSADEEYDGLGKVIVNTDETIANKYFNTTINNKKNGIIRYLTKVPKLDLSNATNLKSLFSGCAAITAFPNLDTSHVTNMSHMFDACSTLRRIPKMDTSNVTDMSAMFLQDYALTEVLLGDLDTSKVTNFQSIFFNCVNLIKVEGLDGSSAIKVDGFFSNNPRLTDFYGLKNLGKAYDVTANALYASYTFSLTSCPKLTHESLMKVIDNLYDIASKGCNTQKLNLGTTNLAKLTAEEIQIATSRGWSVS